MSDIADLADTANDSDRPKHKRWKDAISRTKNKFKKDAHVPQEEFKLSDDVNDFLAAGRKNTTGVTAKQVVDAFTRYDSSAPLSTSNSRDHGDIPSRGVTAPRLDITQSQRWPNAQPLSTDLRSRSDDLLSPDYVLRYEYGRSHSFNSAFAKRRSKPRGLSVTFLNVPPTIIGEGGDEAEAPPIEISRAKQRSQSLSPYTTRPGSAQSSGSDSHSPIRRKAVPPPSPPPPTMIQRNTEREDSIFQPKPLKRMQTGFDRQQSPSPEVTESFQRQLQQALRLDSGDSFKDRFADPRAQHDSVQPPSYGHGDRERTRIPTQGGQPVDDQWVYSETSPQLQTSPDLQQSRETSYRAPPPKIPNFYAEASQQGGGQPIRDEKQSVVYQVQESVLHLSPRSQTRFHGRAGPSPSPGSGLGVKPVQISQQPPQGWI